MKTKHIALLLLVVLALPVASAPPPTKGSAPEMSLIVDNTQYINANNILMFVTNHGNFGRDLTDMFHQDAGTFFPYSASAHDDLVNGVQNTYVNYASGLWIGGKVAGETRVIIAEYSDEYVPGPMQDGTFMEDREEFKVYKLYSDSLEDNPNADYTNWPVDQGAPVDGNGDPDMIGDQMLWAVYNDADPDQHSNDAGETDPLGLEVRQTTFAFDREDPLGNVIFIRLRVYNKGVNTIEDCYLSLWADPDLGGYTDDLVGCDPELSVGFVYNSTNNDQQFGSAPPCMGYDFFQGPLMYTGDDADTARMWGEFWPGYTNLGMVSFNKYINGTDPNDFNETYNYQQGFDADGDPYVYDGDTTLYMHAGDPVTGTGDLDFDPADRRWMQSTGPITFAPGDSTEILAAIIVGQGADRLSSISVMKYYDQFAQDAYDLNFEVADAPAAPVVDAAALNGEIVLTWGDDSEVDPGDYAFQGYTVYQGEEIPEEGRVEWHRVANYDVDDQVGVIYDDVLDPLTGALENVATKFGSDNGVRRFFSTDQDYVEGGSLKNGTPYMFRVEAYSYDGAATPKTQTAAAEVTVTPQSALAGEAYSAYSGDTLEVTHTAGGSNGGVVPIVLDPQLLTGHDYRVTFEDTAGTTAWHCYDVTAGQWMAQWQTNQTGDDDYPIYDGMIVKVTGPDFGVIGIDEVADASGAIDPDNVMYSLNSTADWYVSSDAGSDFSRLNWRGLIGTSDWEFRFTENGSEYYDWNSEELMPNRCPFEVWNIGIGTPDDTSDDVRISIAFLDDDASGGWSYGDRIYPWEHEYGEPSPALMDYVWPDDFKIGRIVFNDYSGATTAPATGTVVRFSTAKVNTTDDIFTFSTEAPTVSMAEDELDDIKVVPNPFYLFSSYDAGPGSYTIKWTNLPEQCTISIYNLAGQFIDKFEKDDGSTSLAQWDAKTQHGLPVASGIYVYVVDAPGYGQKIGKFAVFTEVEVLDQY